MPSTSKNTTSWIVENIGTWIPNGILRYGVKKASQRLTSLVGKHKSSFRLKLG
jgi:hypothetical protein